MEKMKLYPIGTVHCDEDGFHIALDKRYIPALTGLDGFSHLQILWWFGGCDNDRARSLLVEEKPYAKGPERMGVFATRSPNRPNPIAVSCCGVTYIDAEQGIIGLTYIDANDGTPVLDVKPYTPSLDRVAQPETPAWCAHWPKDCESSGDFDWDGEFNF